MLLFTQTSKLDRKKEQKIGGGGSYFETKQWNVFFADFVCKTIIPIKYFKIDID